MNNLANSQAAKLIWENWTKNSRLEILPEYCRPMTRQDGYRCQSKLPEASGRKVLGWKIAATSNMGQAHINVNGPLAGRILSGQIFQDGGEVSLVGNWMRVAEPEIAFCLNSTLVSRDLEYSEDEVMQAVGSLHPSIELPNSRFKIFTTAGEAQLLADNACAHQFILGSQSLDHWKNLDLSKHSVSAKVISENGDELEREGSGANVLGDPRKALTWLVNELSSQGISLNAGEFITTGTCMAPLEITPGDFVTADFGMLGKVSFRFTK
jgi:2-keto-4-pentenoate hydratase